MKRKLLAILLTVSMLFCMLSGCASKQKTTTVMSVRVENTDLDIVVEETETRKTASTTYEGVPMKCEHLFDTDEYWLYLEEEPIKLKVNTLDNGTIEVFTTNEWNEANDEVVGQFVLTASLMVPGFIAAAKTLIGITIGVVVTKYICFSANALGNVIGGIRSSSSTYYRYRHVDITAADAIRFGRMTRYNTYYIAYLSGNTVMIGREINQWTAVYRLKNGYDVFATNDYSAFRATYQAAVWTGKGGIIKHTYETSDGYYPHYHPVGRKWVNNPMSYPQCWYPFA